MREKKSEGARGGRVRREEAQRAKSSRFCWKGKQIVVWCAEMEKKKKSKDGRGEQVAVVRSVVGEEYSEMDIIRALHMAHHDPTAAINIILDLPKPPATPKPPCNSKSPAAATTATSPNPNPPSPPPPPPRPAAAANSAPKPRPSPNRATADADASAEPDPSTSSSSSKWWLVGSSEISGLSTCKGRRFSPGDPFTLSLPPVAKPNASANSKSPPAIMRFSTAAYGEVGRIPNEWARCLIPLLREDKVMIQASCKSAPPHPLSIMDPITLSVR